MQEGRREDAVRHYQEAARVRPEDYQAILLMQSPLHGLGRHEEAKDMLRKGVEVVERHLELNPDDVRALSLGAGALIQLDQRERALEWAQRASELESSDPGVLYNVACVYALGGISDRAFACLDRAIENGFGHREWIENDTDLDSLRADPRFTALQQRL